MDSKLSLKRSLNHWTEEIGGVKFKLKYPSIEQGLKIERLKKDIYEFEYVPDKEEIQFKIKNINESKALEYKRYCIRVWIEDWEGMTEEGKPIKCELVNNELEESLWWALVRDEILLNELFMVFKKEIDFTETDKKK